MNKESLLSPEGFKELYKYLKQKESGELVKVEDIQKHLGEEYDFTTGKITGIIKRAVEKGMITNVKWGTYKLNDYYITGETDDKVSVISEINNEINIAINKIETIIGKNFSSLEDEEIIDIKNKIKALKKL